ncbi:39S ribosomal protein L49, mitochondrial-like [Pomacea canaliculata]|uniref:39S ribosomal protein L49, mitochondrial-like n=1 Tax=Pomacea canaliculata TaxID=400727 RepID=UPI000D731F54|nr:39S ribosomal protein L49, mitochondrial-like [Pomacea canaliculata]
MQLHSSASFESTPQAQIKAGLTEFEVSADPEEFKFVERLLPYKTVPSPPSHTNYPTPSGWIPQKEADLTLPYFVRRTKNHMLPIYQELRNGNTRKLVKIRYIEGDIWALDADLREYLQQVTGSKIIATQVHEIARWIRVKGLYAEHICAFMLKKGF